MSEIQEVLKMVSDVPTLPTTVLEVLQLLEYADCSISDLSAVIAKDPPMTAKILKIANSSYYGFRQSIGTINQAVSILGFSALKNALLSMSMFDLFNESFRGLDIQGLWTHSIGTAAAAKLLAQKLRYPNAEKAFTVGLLHDIGKIIIAKYCPDGALKSLQMAKDQKIKLEVAEFHVLGANHADVGAWLLHRWNLPSTISEAVRLHHQPTLSRDNFDLTAMAYLANILCHHAKLGNSGDRDDLAIDTRVYSYYNFHDADWIDLRDTLMSKHSDISSLLQPKARTA
jgi:putative nucleotidyltransferase with HDIG domain